MYAVEGGEEVSKEGVERGASRGSKSDGGREVLQGPPCQ